MTMSQHCYRHGPPGLGKLCCCIIIHPRIFAACIHRNSFAWLGSPIGLRRYFSCMQRFTSRSRITLLPSLNLLVLIPLYQLNLGGTSR